MLALRIINGMAKQIAIRCSYIRHECPSYCIAQKRVALREFAELVLGTISRLLEQKTNGKCSASLYDCSEEEKLFVKRLKLIKADIHAQLRACNCDISE
ncbi:hypothetical protein HMPREF9550_00970 [Escherichia coli MS 187-1]|nr:hypothetical protein HMPREF9550_00970 [Escherichia coli MS 187-1]